MYRRNNEELVAKFENDVKKRSRVFRLLLVIDQFFNVLLWNGSQDETMSSHIGRRIKNGDANVFDKIICKFLQALESKHCTKSLGE